MLTCISKETRLQIRLKEWNYAGNKTDSYKTIHLQITSTLLLVNVQDDSIVNRQSNSLRKSGSSPERAMAHKLRLHCNESMSVQNVS